MNEHELEIVIDVFNNYDYHIKFTHDIENDNKINFLDVTVHNINTRIENQLVPERSCF